ncbi:putative ATP-dependent RNA helicase DDX24 [Blattamonas nauphoetae]|uniref:ATP-dependent RNA helicase n=1 Tax=Blattamonas nauphoetae TaxID=2049346 RepID=A0ABQ9Y9W5_9EUKA|nr:putative ATP-dependent RNA helicase DDX24 [Blattamonas nauphoetae]
MFADWDSLGICEELRAAINNLGFKTPTEIQQRTLPASLGSHRRSIVGCAETGSGKTLAFGIPVIQHAYMYLKQQALRNPKQSSEVTLENEEQLTSEGDHDDSNTDVSIVDEEDVSNDGMLQDDNESDSNEVHEEDDNEQGDSSSDADIDFQLASRFPGVMTIEELDPITFEPIKKKSTTKSKTKTTEIDPSNKTNNLKLHSLILAPTRELAIQIARHLQNLLNNSPIPIQNRPRVVSIVGGISELKQQRLLSKCPSIVVGTPGRIWDIMQAGLSTVTILGDSEGDPRSFLSDLTNLECFVVDETDRMMQKGHFKEMGQIIGRIKLEMHRRWEDQQAGKPTPPKLQTFLFSATLSLPQDLRRLIRKNHVDTTTKKKQKKSKNKYKQDKPDPDELNTTTGGLLDEIKLPAHLRADFLHVFPFAEQPLIVNLSTPTASSEDDASFSAPPSTLFHRFLFCPENEKDVHLAYFLLRFPGRSLVFINTIRAISFLVSLLRELGITAFGLHAKMEQRQRLKNMDRFTKDEKCVLVVSDVLSRGIDVENVQHVVHYHTPQSVEIYLHRAGRTARAGKEGFSLLLVSPAERRAFSNIRNTLLSTPAHSTSSGLSVSLSQFVEEVSVVGQVRDRVVRARQLALDEHQRQKSDGRFEKKFGDTENQFGGDESGLRDEEEELRVDREETKKRRRQHELKTELSKLNQKPLLPHEVSLRFPTSNPHALQQLLRTHYSHLTTTPSAPTTVTSAGGALENEQIKKEKRQRSSQDEAKAKAKKKHKKKENKWRKRKDK